MKISIIVPIYNTEKYLEKCIDSILNQTFKDFELILVDDGSTDSSGDICDMYAQRDDRIIVLHKENGGLSSARNAGLDIARGEYVSFIDSDDYITNSMMENMYKLSVEANADIAITGRINKFEKRGNETIDFYIKKPKCYSRKEAIQNLLSRNEIDVSVCDKIFKKTVFDNIRFPIGETNEDCAVIFHAFQKSDKFVHTNTADYYYCHRQNSISATLNSKKMQYIVKNGKAVVELIENLYPDLINEAIAFHSLGYRIIYHNITKKAAMLQEITKEENDLFDEAKNYIKKHYKIIKKIACNGNKDKIQLMLIKSGLYGAALKFYYKIRKK